jgi:hypothetical protein
MFVIEQASMRIYALLSTSKPISFVHKHELRMKEYELHVL